MIRAVFELAEQKKPCILFFDEIDSLCSTRKEDDSESSRRVKNEILLQLDQVINNSSGITVIAATNLPYEIDSAVRRRFEKRIFVELPDQPARFSIFETGFARLKNATELAELCAAKTENYSGADCKSVVKSVI